MNVRLGSSRGSRILCVVVCCVTVVGFVAGAVPVQAKVRLAPEASLVSSRLPPLPLKTRVPVQPWARRWRLTVT